MSKKSDETAPLGLQNLQLDLMSPKKIYQLTKRIQALRVWPL